MRNGIVFRRIYSHREWRQGRERNGVSRTTDVLHRGEAGQYFRRCPLPQSWSAGRDEAPEEANDDVIDLGDTQDGSNSLAIVRSADGPKLSFVQR